MFSFYRGWFAYPPCDHAKKAQRLRNSHIEDDTCGWLTTFQSWQYVVIVYSSTDYYFSLLRFFFVHSDLRHDVGGWSLCRLLSKPTIGSRRGQVERGQQDFADGGNDFIGLE